ncbi:MAG: glycosyltransferase family 2 protein [Lewinellaceae bacterium]|nr:glycosyltransferase family 2 protein [Lewinellaceae bacterium]
MPSHFSIIILTHNEEKNLPALLDSLQDLAAPVFVVDSYSTDGTPTLLRERSIPFVQHPFENYSKQRNWAQVNLPLETEWVLHLDAGERCTPEMVHWLKNVFNPKSGFDGYMFSRRTVFFGKWIRRGGHYPNYHLRLFRRDHGRCEAKAYDQHFVCEGPTQHLPAGIDIIDTVCDTLVDFTRSHAQWALYEAIETVAHAHNQGEVAARFFGTPIERRRWLKTRLFLRTPLFLRGFLYFLYRYLLRGGFRDGKMGLVFHFLQGFWFRFLIDANVVELRWRMRQTGKSLEEIIREHYGDQYLKLVSSIM